MKRYLLALDQGTTSSRTILFDDKSHPIASASRAFPQYFPHEGWVEHNAEEIWQSQLDTLQTVLRDSGLSANDIAAIGITNQRETTVVWERATGRPIAPAIVWQCRRTAPDCDRLRARGYEAMIREKKNA